jgi:23S rRNA pseudoU1915 N3-methylase RlmH
MRGLSEERHTQLRAGSETSLRLGSAAVFHEVARFVQCECIYRKGGV